MRSPRVRRPADAFEDGKIDRALRDALAPGPADRAPAGFAARVMDRVYRQALEGRADARQAVARPDDIRRDTARGYRRLGWSFLVTAGVLAVSLLVPRVAYPLFAARQGTEIAREGPAIVRGILSGADDAVRGALGAAAEGGNTR